MASIARPAKRFASTLAGDFYGFTATALNGEEVKFSKYKGKVVLIENTASLWGTTVRDFNQVLKYNYKREKIVNGWSTVY